MSSCLRLPTESNVEEQVQLRHVHPGVYSANQLVLSVENRDSMAFLAAVFTGSNCVTHFTLFNSNLNICYADVHKILTSIYKFKTSNLSGRVDKAQELLALPWTNINAQYANGNTPLILAVQGIYYISIFFNLLFIILQNVTKFLL